MTFIYVAYLVTVKPITSSMIIITKTIKIGRIIIFHPFFYVFFFLWGLGCNLLQILDMVFFLHQL